MMRKIMFFVMIAIITFMSGCTDAQFANITSIGSSATVTLYSGGKEVRVWHSTGKVLTETDSDGYYFKDRDSGKFIRVTGDIVIEN